MKKRVKWLQLMRLVIQAAFLFLLPGLFTMTFGGMKILIIMIKEGSFKISTVMSSLLVPLTLVFFTLVLGRFFCGWFCAFGTFNDLIYEASRKLFKFKFRVNTRLDNVLKYLKYLVLLFIAYFIWIRGNTSFNGLSPWDAFAQIGQIFRGGAKEYAAGFATLGIIALGAMFVERFFCRYLCPLGAAFSIASLVRLVSVKKPTADCGKCTLCTANCSMGINLSGFENSKSKECIWCLKCVENCPRKNAKTSIFEFTFKPVYFALAAIIAFLELYKVDNEISMLSSQVSAVEQQENKVETMANNTAAAEKNVVQENKLYNDGTYIGVGRGFRNNLRVSVTVKNDIITDIKILSHNETPGYYEPAFRIVPKEIVTSQSTDVDGVSGATRTSNGIINAVDDALEQARIS